MEQRKQYQLPGLEYEYNALEPFISERLLRLHHDKHHAAYVNGANAILQSMDKARVEDIDLTSRSRFRELSFHVGGHVLHRLFWENLGPAGKSGGGKPSGTIESALDEEYGSFERFRTTFSAAAAGVEGSGWAALVFCNETLRPIIMQVEKHNLNIIPNPGILMVLDVWEHAYYLDFMNDRARYVEGFWNIVNWAEVNKRFSTWQSLQVGGIASSAASAISKIIG